MAEKQTLPLPCLNTRYGYGWSTTHRITVQGVLKYLKYNPTLDESKVPLSWSTGCDNAAQQGDDYETRKQRRLERHTVPWATLRTFIEQHSTLSLVFEGNKPQVVEEVFVVDHRPEQLSADEQAEMTLALQRQQHVRNEYVRRAYVARNASDKPDEDGTQAALDAEVAEMAVLRALMERWNIPAASWQDGHLAAAEHVIVERAEAVATRSIH